MTRALALPTRGDIVADKYRIDAIVGEGGMGVVFAAHHLILDQRVALKVLVVDALHGDETVERFMREAQAAAQLRSEHVVRVTDAGALDSGLPFLVMEYLHGSDFAHLLRRDGPLEPVEVADTILQVLAALAQAHAAGIIHRDLKPANLFLALREDGTSVAKILDFGISKQQSERARWKELTGKTVLGTPAYISPEQLRSSKGLDARADIWSLGVVIYELLSNRLPFDGEEPGEIFAAVLENAPRPLRDTCPSLAPEWGQIVARCLERSPQARYANVADLARAIAPLGSGRWTHLVATMDKALARSTRTLTRTDSALVEAATAAALQSRPPPALRDEVTLERAFPAGSPLVAPEAMPARFMMSPRARAWLIERLTRVWRTAPRRSSSASVAIALLTVLAWTAMRNTHVASDNPSPRAREADAYVDQDSRGPRLAESSMSHPWSEADPASAEVNGSPSLPSAPLAPARPENAAPPLAVSAKEPRAPTPALKRGPLYRASSLPGTQPAAGAPRPKFLKSWR